MRQKSTHTDTGDNSVAEEMLSEGDDTPADALIFDAEGNLIKGDPEEVPEEFVALKRSKKGKAKK